MNRHDWMRILTKGYRPPKITTKEKTPVKKTLAAPEEKIESNSIEDDSFVSDSEDISSQEIIESKERKPKSKERLFQLKQEEINHFRNKNHIYVYGSDIPAPVECFEQLRTDFEVNDKVIKNLYSEKYLKPTPIQMQAWPLLLKRREVLACAPTGSGKTAAFLMPIIHYLKAPRRKGFRAIILAPTRELAKQIARESDRMTEGLGLKTNIINKVKESNNSPYFKKFDILVTTPNRLIYLLEVDEEVRKIAENVEWLIVDESDKLFEDGKNGFRDQLATIFRACCGPNVVRAMFSATLSFDVEEWCKLNLYDVATVSIGMRNTCPDVEQSLSFCASNAGKMLEIHNILRNGYEIPCLIFVQTKERAKKLCEEILLTGRPVRCIHSDMSQTKRDEIVKEFRQRKIWILICTELMGRGIDFKGVNLVINYDFPPSIISYVHRVGRTGRAGKKGRAITFWSMEDKPLLRNIAWVMKNSGSEVPDWILNIKSSSQKERKRFAKNVPDRGDVTEGMKDQLKKKKKRKNEIENQTDEGDLTEENTEESKPKKRKLKNDEKPKKINKNNRNNNNNKIKKKRKPVKVGR
ncbi:UNVERIFIED_CONTAM: hypothetical protein RMT77_003423 [Armadillidium vulgare]